MNAMRNEESRLQPGQTLASNLPMMRTPFDAFFHFPIALMKTSCLALALTVCLAAPLSALAQSRNKSALEAGLKPGESVVVERGPHHRVWKKAHVITLPDGHLATNVSSYTELGSGLHRWDEQQKKWVDAEAKLEIVGNNAIGRSAAHQVVFAPNANTAGAIDLLTPDGKHLRSHVLGLAVFDTATGRSELIAELKDSTGELYGSNTVIYPDAFDGVKADIRYFYRLGGFEQDIILLENPALPPGFTEETTRLEIWTEFIDGNVPVITRRGPAGFSDDSLDFGAMRTGVGQAFPLVQTGGRKTSAPVAKRWINSNGRTFLIEGVRYPSVKPELEKLPASKGDARANPVPGAQPEGGRAFPKPPSDQHARANDPARKFRMAALPMDAGQASASRRGFVLDYTLNGGGVTNFIFQADTTYYITAGITLYSNTTVEGAAVIKYKKNSSVMYVDGTINWLTDTYRPAVFTGEDDQSIGVIIGTNAFTGYYASWPGALSFVSGAHAFIRHARISHATVAASFSDMDVTLQHVQVNNCGEALEGYNGAIVLENVLMSGLEEFMFADDVTVAATHLTLHGCTWFSDSFANNPVALTNSLILDLANWGSASISSNSIYVGSSSSVFQSVGAGNYYLANNSPHRNAGIPIFGALSNEIRQLTTYPPIVFSNSLITVDTVLYPQAQRDTDTPDLGAHLAPIDYAVGWLAVTNATLTLTGGVAVAAFNSTGFWLQPNSHLISAGSPTARNTIVRYNLVQEQPVRWGSWSGYTMMIPTSSAELSLRFTDVWIPGEGGTAIYTSGSYIFTNLTVRDCCFGSDRVQFLGGGAYNVFSLTNNLFHRSIVDFSGFSQILAINNLFYGGFLGIDQYGVQTGWILRNNILDSVSLDDLNEYAELNYNAYVGGTTPISPGTNATDKVVASISYDPGPLGRFYLPTNSVLINAGSTNADYLGFYHYTTSATNQVKETNSFVDIGLHYAALNSSGQPIDGDGDGVPDYLEDANGNSAFDSSAGETDWQAYNSRLGIGIGPGLVVFTPLR